MRSFIRLHAGVVSAVLLRFGTLDALLHPRVVKAERVERKLRELRCVILRAVGTATFPPWVTSGW